MERLFFDSSFGKISYIRREGKGILLFIHGFTASSDIWKDLIEKMDSRFSIISIDLFGHGGSGLPNLQYNDFSLRKLIRTQSEAIFELLDHLKVKEYSMIASSFGGLISIDLATSFLKPERLVLIDSAGLTPGGDRKFENGFKALMSFYANETSRHLYPIAEIFKSLDRGEQLINPVIARNVDFPICIIWGSEDYIFDPEYGRKFSNLFSRTEFHIIEGAGHTPFTTHQKEVAEIINKFIFTNISSHHKH